MAWNEPGNKSDKNGDGWGPKKNGGNNNEGPPDLDEVLGNLVKKIKLMFAGGGGSDGQDISLKHMLLPLILVSCIYIASGFFIVKPPEKAVITLFGKFNSEVSQGLHWIPTFIKSKSIINTEAIRTTRRSGLMLTQDINLVSVTIEVQYRIENIKQYLFNVRNPSFAIDEASDSALRQVVGQSKFDYIISVGKEDIAARIEQQIQETLNSYRTGVKITTLALKEAIYPKQVETAFDEVTKSKEEREQLKHNAEAYANKVIPEARGQANRILERAKGYEESTILNAKGQTMRFRLILPEYKKDPNLTRKRMYFSTMEQVYKNTSKVLVDVPNGNNLLYLPIDRLMSSAKSSSYVEQQTQHSDQQSITVASSADAVDDRRVRRRR